MVEQLIDTSAQEDGWEKQSAREDLEKIGLRTNLAQKKNLMNSMIMHINQLYKHNRLYIMKHCTRTHREQMLHVYKKSRTGIMETPEDRFNDMIANMRYIFAVRPGYTSRAEIKDRPVPYRVVI